MGSDSDLTIMQEAANILKQFNIPFELTVVSAHRTQIRMVEYATTAKQRGLQVSSNYISKILKSKYELIPEKNSSYKWYRSSLHTENSGISTGFTNEKGRFYRFKKEMFQNSVV